MVKSTVISIAIVRIGSITIQPLGPITLVLPTGQTSIQQTFTGTAMDDEATPQPVPNATLFVFINGTQATVTTSATGTYSYTATFTPGTLPANYTLDVSDNSSNT
jgi:hypothetical protein